MTYNSKLVTPPAIEPVTIAELKEHCRVVEDLAGLAVALKAARAGVESFLGRSLISQVWEAAFDLPIPPTVLELPRPPVISVDSVVYYGEDDASNAFAATNYVLDGVGGRVFLKKGVSWPVNMRAYRSFVWTYAAGYGTTAAAVPTEIIHGIKLLAAHLYENREAASRSAEQAGLEEIPWGIRDMLYPHRVVVV